LLDRGRFGREFGPRDRREPPRSDKKDPRAQQSFQRPFHEERQQEPAPVNGKCSQLCPLFWCTKRAYQLRRDPSTGRRYVFCAWIGDECIGASCQYATCRGNYLLPDGTCAWVKQKRAEEMAREEDLLAGDILDDKARELVSKRLGKKLREDFF